MAEYVVGPYERISYTGSMVQRDKTVVFVGTGLPMIAILHAQRTHAPDINIIFEAGSLGVILWMGLPLSVGDTRASTRSCIVKGLCLSFELQQRGHSDIAFIGGAQVDEYGNINSTCMGDVYEKPRVRFPGSGGAGAMAANSARTIMILALEKRRFTKVCDFITSIGYGDGSPGYRWRAGVHGDGPYRVICDSALFGFREDRKMELLQVRPGLTKEEIHARCDFDLLFAPQVVEMPDPPPDDLKLLIDVIDPEHYFLGKKVV